MSVQLRQTLMLCGVMLLAPFIVMAQTADSDALVMPTNPEALDAYLRDYLLRNPEVVVEAIQRWQIQQAEAEAAAVAATLAARQEELTRQPDDPVIGNPNGDVTIVEFMDYNCGFCRRVYPVIADLLARDGNIRVVFKELPVLGPGSVFASQAALAARQQNLYEPFHDAMMTTGERLDEAQVLTIAAQVGLDVEQLQEDMQSPAIQAMLARNAELAGDLSISGTPSFVIGDEIVRGATDLASLEALVAQARSEN